MSISNRLSRSFDERYTGTPGWDIPGPQRVIVTLADEGRMKDPVLDIGCGTGENSLFLAARGYHVTGIDFSPLAIEKARMKSFTRKADVEFIIHDALQIHTLGRQFRTVIDSGLFHVFSDRARKKFEKGLRKVILPGGLYYMICFSELEPAGWGPRRITQEEIRNTFSNGWSVTRIEPTFFDTTENRDPVRAWLASIQRTV